MDRPSHTILRSCGRASVPGVLGPALELPSCQGCVGHAAARLLTGRSGHDIFRHGGCTSHVLGDSGDGEAVCVETGTPMVAGNDGGRGPGHGCTDPATIALAAPGWRDLAAR